MDVVPTSIRQVAPLLMKIHRNSRKGIIGPKADVGRFDSFEVLRENEQVEVAVWPQPRIRVETGVRPALHQNGIGPVERIHR
jgi:hypothetical protein